jgi:hypothetical protein
MSGRALVKSCRYVHVSVRLSREAVMLRDAPLFDHINEIAAMLHQGMQRMLHAVCACAGDPLR